MGSKIFSDHLVLIAALAIHGCVEGTQSIFFSFTNKPKEINQLSIDVKVLMISFPRLSCLVLS